MKLILYLIALFFSSYSLGQVNHNFSIEVHFKDAEGKKIYLSDTKGGGKDRTEAATIDSLYINNGKCVFTGNFNDVKYYSIAVDSMNNFSSFIIDTGRIIVTGNANEYLWRSLEAFSPQNNLKRIAEKKIDSLDNFREVIQDSLLKYMGKNETLEMRYSRKMDSIDFEKASFLLLFIKKNPNSFYAFSQLNEMHSITSEVNNLIRNNYQLFSDDIKNSTEGKHLYKSLTHPIESLIGKKLPGFSYYNIDEQMTHLAIQEKKFYLIDYWASWCGPCIATIPALRNLQNKFGDKELQIISISFDLDFLRWKTAIQKHKIDWPNYRDTNSFNSEDAKYFEIEAIPFKVLIDKEGYVIQINPSFGDIEKFLSQQK